MNDDLRGRALAQAMWTELEKISMAHSPSREKTPSIRDRVLKAAPGVGAVVGGVAGAANPKLFNPSAFLKGQKGTTWKGRLISGIMGAGAGATTGWLPTTLLDAKNALSSKNKTAEVIEGPDGSPAVKVLGASIEKLDERIAHGVPIVEPPPGFVYDPELAAFVANSNDPGWLTEDEAAEAQEKAQLYQKSQGGAQQSMAQIEAGQAATQVPQQQQQQIPDVNQGTQTGQTQQAANKINIPQPKQITGLHPMAQPESTNVPMQPKVKKPQNTSATSIAR